MCSSPPGARSCTELEDQFYCFGHGTCCIHERISGNDPFCICQTDWDGKRCNYPVLKDYDGDVTPSDHLRATMPYTLTVVVVCLITAFLFVRFVRGHAVHHCRRNKQLNWRQRYMAIYSIPDSVVTSQSHQPDVVTSLSTDQPHELVVVVGAETSSPQHATSQCQSWLLSPVPSMDTTSSSSTSTMPLFVASTDGAISSRDATAHCHGDVVGCELTTSVNADVIL